ncbi:lipid-A-disaccharide synthase [Winogradskyella psychrotolerans]|uniref:lipid-A-disaccharide synthase n=1 Tax=Winogradskyella psychrotolerans TaxID=1344585 RepID=UPI001C06DD29|nr:lipid-A-disaccharide synthase [Winogradskyella psychrotolerans]MBU2927634.1 lipid-A-disaccharide synthase [Winogradskyella psychrotolerans]
MKYYIIAGEASGDLHGSNLMKALFKQDEQADIRFWGGDLMQNVGGELVMHYKERQFMGFAEVILNLRKVLGQIKFCKLDIEKFQPDVIIFIDNSGFNLRIAKWAKALNFKTHYYISPQVWASRASRVEKIKNDIDAMYCILPFEKSFYKKYDYDVNFVGHPLIDAIANRPQVDGRTFRKEHDLNEEPIIALLPGSRKQEITKMLGVMLSLVDDFKDYQFVIAGAPSQDYEFYKGFIKQKNIKFISNKTYDLLSISTAALVTSGTATLETALFKVPQVVCYKANAISYQIAKRIITLKYISLVNLIMDREVVTELIQGDLNKKRLKKELTAILDTKKREQLFLDYYELEKILGGRGASEKTAKLIYNAIRNSNK